MRRRSYAVHASDFDEYKTVSKAKALYNDPSSSSPYQLASSSSEEASSKQTIRHVEREAKRADPDLWKEFDFKPKAAEEGSDDYSQTSTADSFESSGSRHASDFGIAKSQVQVSNYMIIGSQETGIHRILNNVFESSEPSVNHSAMLDLVIKEQEVQGQQYKLKFWIQDPTHQRYQEIVQTYYTANKTYFFVYKSDNRKSFECLAAVIEKVKAKLAAGNFSAFLVCDAADSKEVSEEEAEKLVERFGLVGKLETGDSLVDFKNHVYQALSSKSE